EKVNFYTLKANAEVVLKKLGLHDLELIFDTDTLLSECISYTKGDKLYLRLGKLNTKIQKELDIQTEVFYAEFNWSLILKKRKVESVETTEHAKLPSVRRDLSMLIDKEVNFEQLRKIAWQTEKHLLKEVSIFDVYEGDKLPVGK